MMPRRTIPDAQQSNPHNFLWKKDDKVAIYDISYMIEINRLTGTLSGDQSQYHYI